MSGIKATPNNVLTKINVRLYNKFIAYIITALKTEFVTEKTQYIINILYMSIKPKKNQFIFPDYHTRIIVLLS